MIKRMNDRGARLGGFRVLLGGAAGIMALLVYLNPAVRREGCPNAGGNGNASAFGDSRWDLGMIVILVVWMIAVVVEQTLPSTWRHRGNADVALRAIAAPLVAVTASCCFVLKFVALCH